MSHVIRPRLPLIGGLISTLTVVFVWSAIAPLDRFTWFLEVLPVILGVIILAATFKRFPLTRLAYICIWLHAIILCVGGHYTYEQVPLGEWFQEWLDLSRNHYDRLGHVAQGFFPAIVAREIMIRKSPLKPGGWLFFLVTCYCLAFSAFFEMIEWWVALASGSGADAYLATQGDVWDTQWDMFLCLLGSMVSLILLSRLHNRQLGVGSKPTEAVSSR